LENPVTEPEFAPLPESASLPTEDENFGFCLDALTEDAIAGDGMRCDPGEQKGKEDGDDDDDDDDDEDFPPQHPALDEARVEFFRARPALLPHVLRELEEGGFAVPPRLIEPLPTVDYSKIEGKHIFDSDRASSPAAVIGAALYQIRRVLTFGRVSSMPEEARQHFDRVRELVANLPRDDFGNIEIPGEHVQAETTPGYSHPTQAFARALLGEGGFPLASNESHACDACGATFEGAASLAAAFSCADCGHPRIFDPKTTARVTPSEAVARPKAQHIR
jgi:hypothetical protein